MDLGFGDMGEVVAEKWTEDNEQLFDEIVYSNHVSSGRNFWNHLAVEFPSRSNQEIVSYYFNVFMLRRRTEQNRLDPTSADSDDDESPECDSEPRKLHNSCSYEIWGR
ncbi:putative SANT/Myb domain-containing protein [Helianthus debilis subsp. tardiflorus]